VTSEAYPALVAPVMGGGRSHAVSFGNETLPRNRMDKVVKGELAPLTDRAE
jgi:hypothetical protein